MRRTLAVLAAIAVLALPAITVAQTATPLALATPAADASTRTDAAGSMQCGRCTAPAIFQGGAQFGRSVDGASQVQFFKRGTCVYDPTTLLTDVSEYVSCAATGTLPGDYCSVVRRETINAVNVGVISCTAFTDKIQFRLMNATGSTINPPAGTFDFIVIR